MNNNSIYSIRLYDPRHFVSGTRVVEICSFTEFFPFCKKLYYFSNFKDFNKLTQA